MPELPEAEFYRRLLLPLVSTKHSLRLERPNGNDYPLPTRNFLSEQDIHEINSSHFFVSNVIRKGKLICMVLNSNTNDNEKYLFVHMGMTGGISTPQQKSLYLKSQKGSEMDNNHEATAAAAATTTAASTYPPRFTHIKFVAGPNEACFSDQRKFGSVFIKDSLREEWDGLAPDAWTELVVAKNDNSSSQKNCDSIASEILLRLTNKSVGIKALLLDQKRAVSGVGNWIADEVLYQIKMHPNQTHLSEEQAEMLLRTLHQILETAVQKTVQSQPFPKEWLFHYRWSKGKKSSSNSSPPKDAMGRPITFVTSGGRTSAIVPAIQKLKSQQKLNNTSSTTKHSNKNKNGQRAPLKGGDLSQTDPAPSTTIQKRKQRSESSKGQSSDGDDENTKIAKTVQTRRRSPRFA
jgi:formamidopyrimidine-DNA glycosylase